MLYCRSSFTRMGFYDAIIAIQIFHAYSASIISLPSNDDPLSVAAANVVNRCIGSSEGWSELLIIPDHSYHELLKKINHESKTANLIVFPDGDKNDEVTMTGKCYNNSNAGAGWNTTKTTAVVIIVRSLRDLQFTLDFLKYNMQSLWRPRSYFLIVAEARCDVIEYNSIFKVVWNYWILDAVILCPSNDPDNQNGSKIDLYTFNPYSDDHSQQWETIVNETVKVSISPGNFNHSWFVFKQTFTESGSSEECGNLFFDKTLNLDGYEVPIGFSPLESSWGPNDSVSAHSQPANDRTLNVIGNALRFKVTPVFSKNPKDYGHVFKNGCYSGVLEDVHSGRTHLLSVVRAKMRRPDFGMTYPHTRTGVCFASQIGGIRPQWTNLVEAKQIWIAFGLGLSFSTLVFYVQNTSLGISSAFLNAERLIIGSAITRASRVMRHRIILGSIFLVMLVVDGAIRGRFISILTVARRYGNLDSLEQLKEHEVNLYGHVTFLEAITDPKIRSGFNTSLIGRKCFETLKRGDQRIACIGTCQSLQFMNSNSSGIHIASTPILTTDVGFLTTANWPMTNRYSFNVQKLVEAGIYKKWQLDIYRNREIDSWKLKREVQPPYVKPTKLNDLLPAFVLLFVGLSIATSVFAWEIKSNRYFVCAKS